jgi:hypothetical protein
VIPQFTTAGLRRTALALWGHLNAVDLPAWQERFDVQDANGEDAHRALLQGQIPSQGNSPLRLCAMCMDPVQFAPTPTWSAIWVIARPGFDELLNFWNYRALTSPFSAPLIAIPRESFRQPEQLGSLTAWLRPPPGMFYSVDIGVHCPRYLLAEVRAALAAVGFVEEPNPEFRYTIGTGVMANEPPKFFFPPPRYHVQKIIRGASASSLVAFSAGRALLSLAAPANFKHRSLRHTRLVFLNLPCRSL